MATSGPAAAPFAFADFRHLQFGRIAAIVAVQAQGVAVAWEVFSHTRRPLDLGYVGLAQFLPIASLSLFAGHAADRFDRRKLLTVVYAAFAALSLALFAYSRSGATRVWPIYVILVLQSTAASFGRPTAAAMLPEVVPPAVFERAVAWSSSMWQAATIIGPAIGGALLTVLASRGVYLLAACLSSFASFYVSRVERVSGRAPIREMNLATLLAGVRYVWAHSLILGSVSLDLFAVLLGGAVALMPIFADLLHVGPWGLGLLRSAPGVGAALSGVYLAYRPLRRRAGLVMFACVAGFGLATIGFAFSNNFALSLVLLFVSGATDMVSVVVRQTLLQIETPNDMRGRVSAVNLVFVGASNELGEFESGLTGQWLGPRAATWVGGVGTLLVVAIWSALFPSLREVDRLTKE
jgi:MFS family permease